MKKINLQPIKLTLNKEKISTLSKGASLIVKGGSIFTDSQANGPCDGSDNCNSLRDCFSAPKVCSAQCPFQNTHNAGCVGGGTVLSAGSGLC